MPSWPRSVASTPEASGPAVRSPRSRPRALTRGRGDALPLLALLDLQARARADFDGTELAQQLAVALEAVAVKRFIRQGSLDRTARLRVVSAIAEPALERERLDVLEQVVDPLVALPQLRLAKAGRIDDHAAARQLHQLAMARRVPSLSGRPVDLARPQQLGAEDGVDEGGLARSRRTEQHAGPGRAQLVQDRLDALAGDAAGDDHRRPGGNRREVCLRRLDRVGDVGLGDQDDRHGPALPRHGQEALDPPHVDFGRRRHDERDVDVRRQDLAAVLVAGCPARKDGAALDDSPDLAAGEGHPVADGRVDVPGHRPLSAYAVMDEVAAPMVGEHARNHGARRRDRDEAYRETGIPAQRCELESRTGQL